LSLTNWPRTLAWQRGEHSGFELLWLNETQDDAGRNPRPPLWRAPHPTVVLPLPRKPVSSVIGMRAPVLGSFTIDVSYKATAAAEVEGVSPKQEAHTP
jgi:hypothetical protein